MIPMMMTHVMMIVPCRWIHMILQFLVLIQTSLRAVGLPAPALIASLDLVSSAPVSFVSFII